MEKCMGMESILGKMDHFIEGIGLEAA